jgi:tetratricopeptide (TPR) repeat protein
MYTFLATCTDRDGRDVVTRVRAGSLKHAREILEEQGYTNVVLQDDPELYGSSCDAIKPSPALELEMRRTGVVPWWPWLRTWALNLSPLLAWNAWSLWQGPPWSGLDRTGFALTALGVGAALLLGVPMHLYNCLLAASAWHRWDRVLRLAPPLIAFARLIRSRPFEADVRFRQAQALVGTGRRRDAFERVRGFDRPGHELGRLADLHWEAGDREQAIACMRRVTEVLPDKADGWIDLARLLLLAEEHAAARTAIERARGLELHATAHAFVAFADGVLALEAGEPARAVEMLEQAIRRLAAVADNPLAQACRLYWGAYLALALAAAGRRDEARAKLAASRLLLHAIGRRELLARCERAVA